MTPDQRTARLRQIKSDRDLTAGQIGRILDRSTDTVFHWLSGNHYVIPPHALRLLEKEVQPHEA